MSKLTDYFHISGNNGSSDSNESIHDDFDIDKIFKNFDLNNKNITLGIYTGIDDIKKKL